MSVPTECSRCKGPMDVGLVLDRGDANIAIIQQWVEGAPETNFWTGLKTKGRESFKVLTYRCDRCGYLESYATERVDQ